jgi:hypothetical protein
VKFISTASAGDVTTYRAKGYAIVHEDVGFGIPRAKVYTVDSSNHERLQCEFAGKNCLKFAMDWCRQHAAGPVPELHFATYSDMQR